MRLHLNIGSNSGERYSRIRVALAAVCKYFANEGGHITISAPIRSHPWGFESPNEFLNVGVMAYLPGEASEKRLLQILDAMQEIEQRISHESHRNPDGSYRDREIDIDLIITDIPINHPRLTLPHPLAHKRPFVLSPLRDLDPNLSKTCIMNPNE